MRVQRSTVLGIVSCLIGIGLLTTTIVLCRIVPLTRGFHAAAATIDVNVTVDTSHRYQVLDGFGQAEPSVLATSGKNQLSDSLRIRATGKAFHEVGINMGIIGSLLESPGEYDQRRNDNDNPFDINWNGFNPKYLEAAKRYLLDLAKPYGFDNYFLGAEAPNVRWASPWLADIRQRDYNRFLDEAAEQVLANLTWWKNTYGEELPYYQLGNEQLSGNHASMSPDGNFGSVNPVQQMVDITKRAGARIRAAGFANTRFIVGSEETEEISLLVATAILSDAEARTYVAVIGYHGYPYNTGYSSASFILHTSGAGRPDHSRILVRNQLRDLGRKYNVKVWMTENSHCGKAPLSYDDFRARTIQIHDEFLYADASAYFAEFSIWDLTSQRGHFGNDHLYDSDDEGNVVLINNDTGAVDITGIGYAIGHYARWIKPGSIRVDAISSDPLVQITAFHIENRKQIVLVLTNNADEQKRINISFDGLSLSGDLTGEQSTPEHYWQALRAFPPSSTTNLSITVPKTSVTTITGPLGAVYHRDPRPNGSSGRSSGSRP